MILERNLQNSVIDHRLNSECLLAVLSFLPIKRNETKRNSQLYNTYCYQSAYIKTKKAQYNP